jgi:2-C-methyl-D-erythritol 4-phosphate cytidylyltransferase
VAQVLLPVQPGRVDSFARDHAAVDALRDKRVKIICGSSVERYDTIRLALAQLAPDITHVAVHDAARPLLPQDLVFRLLAAARLHDAVLPALAVADTLRRGSVAGKEAQVLGEIVPRAGLLAVQTPQMFERKLLERAYANLPNLDPKTITDDAGLIEALGEKTFAVAGDPRNLKLTQPADWDMIQALELASRVKVPGVKAFCCR